MDISLELVLKDNCFSVYKASDGFILCNSEIEGFAHTHLNNKSTAEYLIRLSKKKKIPRDISRYLLISLIRINSDNVYLQKLNDLLENRKKKGVYRNRPAYYCR